MGAFLGAVAGVVWELLCLWEGDQGSPHGHASDTPRTHKGERTYAKTAGIKYRPECVVLWCLWSSLPCPLILPLHGSPLHAAWMGWSFVFLHLGAFFLSNQDRRMGFEKVARPLKRTGLGLWWLCGLYLCQHWQDRVGEWMRMWLLCVAITYGQLRQ